MELHVESFTVQSMVDDVAATAQRLVAQNGNKFVVRGQPDLGEMTADLTKVRQILFNLLSNAAKFTETGSVTLAVEPSASGTGTVISVTDTGVGLSEEERTRVFEEFFQARTPLHATTRGTGLGLAFALGVAQALGGGITVTSTPGVGSRFALELPEHPPVPEPAP
jgi:signal transduction histidine kinase